MRQVQPSQAHNIWWIVDPPSKWDEVEVIVPHSRVINGDRHGETAPWELPLNWCFLGLLR